jgi:feruloyl esterase
MRWTIVTFLLALSAWASEPDAATRCGALKGAEIVEGDALIKVWGPFTNFVPADAQHGAYCQVTGYVAPRVGFEIRLPAEEWNGKLLEVGCGGDCGYIAGGACRGPLDRGYACIATDTGHRGQGGAWAYNDADALIDFGYRAMHVVAVAGKAIVRRHYGSAPRHAYFFGCSTGGRQALVEAQRFPWDFDGIISGAPWINDSDSAMNYLWAARALAAGGQGPILSETDLKLVHDAALAACDGDDGLRDGIIGNPARCAFDPAMLVCKGERNASCISAAQAAAVRSVYRGPVDSRGRSLYPGGAMPGSELNWIDFGSGSGYIDGQGGAAESETWATNFFRYMTLPPAGPSWRPGDFNFDTDRQRFASGAQESLTNASNPDLRKFAAAGGKLLVYQGWNDESVVPPMTIDYYEAVDRVMGGGARTRDFARLYLVPGMNHCGAGDGAFAIDYLSALEAWVEKGTPPDVLVGAHLKDLTDADGATIAPLARKFPIAAADVVFTRPVYPYPLTAVYSGKGDVRNASSFAPASPHRD